MLTSIAATCRNVPAPRAVHTPAPTDDSELALTSMPAAAPIGVSKENAPIKIKYCALMVVAVTRVGTGVGVGGAVVVVVMVVIVVMVVVVVAVVVGGAVEAARAHADTPHKHIHEKTKLHRERRDLLVRKATINQGASFELGDAGSQFFMFFSIVSTSPTIMRVTCSAVTSATHTVKAGRQR